MDRIQVPSLYNVVLVVSACLTLTSAFGDVSYMQPIGAGGGMFVSDISYDTPDHAFIAPFGAGGLAGAPFGGGFVSSVDIGDTYYMPGLPTAPLAAPAVAPVTQSRQVIQAFPTTTRRRSSYSRGITSRRYGGGRVRLYVV